MLILNTETMKTFSFKTFFAMFILITHLFSCNQDDSDGTSNGASEEFLTAKIDGASWSASTDYDTTEAIISISGNITVLAFQGSDNNGNAINLSLPNYTGPGTYKTGDSLVNTSQIMYVTINPSVASWMSNLASAALNLTPGTITITTDNGEQIEGAFSFDGYDGTSKTIKKITEGKFKINIK